MPRARSRPDRSGPPRPHAQAPLARRGRAQVFKLGERGEQARHTPRQRVVAEVAAEPKRTRPLGGATPHPQKRCAPYRTRAPYPWDGMPLEYSVVTSRARGPPLRVQQRPCCRTAPGRRPRPRSTPPTCFRRHAALLGAEPTDPTLLGRTHNRRWQEGGTHRYLRWMSAESELGTLPVSAL
jgi:hypothetical protein